MADEGAGAATNGTPPPEPAKEQMVPISRLNAQGTKIAQLEQQLQAATTKAASFDTLQTQFTEQGKTLQQFQNANSLLRAAAPHGFQPEVIDHLAGTYTNAMGQTPEQQRAPFGQWLNSIMADPSGLDAVSRAVVKEHLASRTVPPSVAASASPATPAATPSVTQPATPSPTQPVVPAPASNAGVKPTPTPAAQMTEQEIRELIRDPAKFKEWKKNNPVLWDQLNRRGIR